MNAEFCKDIGDILKIFEESLSPSEALYAKLISQISTQITKERLKSKMTQAEFASHIGAKQSQISHLESGNLNLTVKKLAEIAAPLGLDVNIVMSDMGLNKIRAQHQEGFYIIQRLPDDFSTISKNNECYPESSEATTASEIEEVYNHASIH